MLYTVRFNDSLWTRYLLSNQLLTYGARWFVGLELELELLLLFHFKWTCIHSFDFISRLSDVPITIYIPYWIVGILLAFLTILSFLASIDSIRSVVSQPIAFIAKGGKYWIVFSIKTNSCQKLLFRMIALTNVTLIFIYVLSVLYSKHQAYGR